MDRALEHGINFFDTAERVRLEARRGRHRADHRPLVRPGRRPARQGRPRHQGLRQDGRLAQRAGPVRPAHHRGVRGLAAPAADRLHRPLPDAPRLPDARRGRRSGRRWRLLVAQGKVLYVGSSNFAGWHIAAGAGVGRRRRHFLGLVSEQCIYNLLTRHVELEVVPAAQQLRHRHHPVVAAARRPALRRAAQAGRGHRRGRSGVGPRRTTPRAAPGRDRGRTRSSAPTWARTRPTWPWPGCCPGPA